MGTGRWVAGRPLLWVFVCAPLGACSCDDRLVDMNFRIPDVEVPGAAEIPDPAPVARTEVGFAAVASGSEGCDGAPLPLRVQVVGGEAPYRYSWDPHPDLSDPLSPAPVATGLGTREFFVTVRDGAGREVRTSATVTRFPLPIPAVAFAEGDDLVCAGTEVALDGSGSRSADGSPPAAIAWDLEGDGLPDLGGPSTGPFLPVNGQTVQLTVTDVNGCSASTAVTLAVRENPRPFLRFASGDEGFCVGESVSLDASGSLDAEGSPIADFRWDFDGDGAVDAVGPSSGTLSPAASSAITLTLADRLGCTTTLVQPLEARQRPTPVISFTSGGDRLCAGEAFAVDGSASRDARGDPVAAYRWELDGDSSTVDSTAAAPPAVVAASSRTVRLTVVDRDGCDATVEAPVAVRPLPTADIAFVTGDDLSCAGETVALSGAGSRDVDGRPVAAFAWELDGDGRDDGSGPTPPPFAPAADATVRLVVTDFEGCRATATRRLQVRPPPTVSLRFTRGAAESCGGTPVALDASGSSAAGGGNLAFAWDLDGNGSVDGTGPTFGPFVPGDGQALRVTVRDDAGCAAVAEQTFTVFPGPTAVVDVVGPTRLCDGDVTAFDGSRSQAAGSASYAWDLDGNGTLDATTVATGPVATSGPVALTVTDENACTATATAAVDVLGPRQLYPFGAVPGSGNGVVDIIFVIDNSGSMGEEIAAVEDNINVNFADIIQASNVDYRIILISKHGRNQDQSICVRSPLSGTTCRPRPPNRPANTARFFHYDVEVGSWNSLQLLLDTFHQRDRHGFAPNGWSGWLRPGARKVFVEITDDESNLSATAFENALFQLSPDHFGTAQARNFVWHSIVGLAANSPPTEAWPPWAPLQGARCSTAPAPGLVYQELSRRTGGLRFPICAHGSFDAVFEAIAEEVIEDVLSCELSLPASDPPNPETLEIEHTPGDGGGILVYRKVPDPSACTGDGFYLDGSTVRLCPGTCAAVQGDPGGSVALSGCGP
jgi:hypothetical protein